MIDSTLGQIAPRFDAFLVDQFGVLLNGSGAYPYAAAALHRLARLGKPILLLSNSGKRAAQNEHRLSNLGFDRRDYLGVMSSGEAAFSALSRRIGQEIPMGAKVWTHSRDADRSATQGLNLTAVETPDDADLLLLAGSQGDQHTMADYVTLLAKAAARQVPMICTNPDLEMLTPQGICFGAGAIAARYAQMGGPVDYIGKPYPLIYTEAALRLSGIAPHRILCIGDSPPHDVAGGRRAGHATALVRSGLHAELTLEALRALCRAEQAMPDFILPAFDLAEEPTWP